MSTVDDEYELAMKVVDLVNVAKNNVRLPQLQSSWLHHVISLDRLQITLATAASNTLMLIPFTSNTWYTASLKDLK